MKNIPIGQILVEQKLINEEQLSKALGIQKASGKMLGDILVELGYITESQFAQALAARLKVPYVDLKKASISIEAVKKIPEATAKKNTLFAFSCNNHRLSVATNDPINFYIMEEVKAIAGMEVYPVLATKASIKEAIEKYYSMQNMSTVIENINKEYVLNDDFTFADNDLSEERIENAPVVKLVNTILENAFHARASDIHIEPFRTKTIIRIRIDGDLVEQMTISNVVHTSLTTRLKILSGMNIAEKRVPQDGRFSYEIDGIALDVRVSNLPTVHGEKVVIRLLSVGDSSVRKITDLGMTDYNYKMFSEIIKSPHGIILVTGPTGSGKTTTLYSVLGELAKPNVNIISVEDPVEKTIEGINQVQVNTKAGLTFAAGLRSILRQDPDIIMIGEIRDSETADIAIRAAITGHLVLSTLHTNDAISTILRLVDMGVAPYMVTSSIIGVVAQRLVKLLCPHCKRAYRTDEIEMSLLGIEEPVTIYKAGGCSACNNLGYRSRTSIHEIVQLNAKMKQAIMDGHSSQELVEIARQNGTRLLRDNVSGMVLEGKTTMEELIRATYSV